MALTAVEVRSLKLRDRAYKVSDSDGLQVHVQPTGQRYWRYAFRWAGRQQTMALGVFPAVSLSEARAKRDAAKKLLASGSNPATVAREEKRAALLAEQVTFKVVAEQWVAKSARAVRSQPDCRCGSRTTGGQGRPFNFAGTVVPVGISLPEMVAVYEAVIGSRLDQSSFRRKIMELGALEPGPGGA